MTTDNHQPGEKWEFNKEVADCFDDMLERSIPQYDVMRRTCFEIGSRFVEAGTTIVDLGCSNGGALADFVGRFGHDLNYVGADVSQPMLAAARKRFAGQGNCWIREHDLRKGMPTVDGGVSLVLSVLTLQFTPIEYRLKILDSIFQRLRTGGALVIVEKVLGGSAFIDDLFTETYYDSKAEHGYDQEAIARKRASLEGVLVPVTANVNQDWLRQTGFQVDCFWRWCNFAGWVAIK